MRGDEYAGHWQREQASNREVLLRLQFRLQRVEQALLNLALRRVNPFDEVAFLGLECRLAGAPWIGPRLVAGLSAELDERPPPALVHPYTAQLDPDPRTPGRWAPLAQRYVALALGALDDLEGWCPLSDASALATG